MTLNGIDISHHQRNIDLGQVASDFVIAKATEGYGYTDPKFSAFAKDIKSRGRLRGFYHFARADLNPGNAGAKKEADWFVKTVKPHLDGKTILVLDYEGRALSAGTGWCKTFLDRVYKETGIRALVYTSSSVVSSQNWASIHHNHELWLANYGADQRINGYNPPATPKTKYWASPTIHQYSQYGRLPGYSGNLDLNVGFLSADEWTILASGNPSSKPTAKAQYTMVSPVEGYLTQNFKTRIHLGVDIGTGGKKMPVYAAFPGKVVQIIRGIQPGNRQSTYAPGRTSNVVIIQNVGPGTSNDGEYQAYGHVTARSDLRVGDQVLAGQHLGDLDRSGNTTGWHLHLEMWNKNKVAYNPRLAFDRWGVKIGSKPKVNVKPKPKPVKPSPKPPKQGSAKIRKIQQDLNKYANAGLYVDGINGPVTKAWVAWVKDAQRQLPKFRGVPKLVVDGHYGPVMANAVRVLQRRNGLFVDGVLGPKTIAFMRKHGSKIKSRPRNRP